MSWEPDNELVEWAKGHLKGIGIGGVWAPADSGVTYIRQDEETFALVRIVDHPSAMEHHEKFSIIMEKSGFNVIEGDGEITVPPAMTADENAMQEYEHKQRIAQGWRCECEFPLANFDLDDRKDVFVEVKDILLSDGEVNSVEVWACIVTCPNCEKQIEMDPDDYHLLAGDAYFMRWVNSQGTSFLALTRNQMMELAEAGDLGVLVGKTCPHTDERVPPWLWGTYCMSREASVNDEEE